MREQNWVAVALEFLIVVSGVVIGFQINAWAEERSARAAENALLARLTTEVERALEEKREELEALRTEGETLTNARHLADTADHPAFTPELCNVLDSSHVILWTPAATPLLDELNQTGELGSVSNQQLRNLISRVIFTRQAVYERIGFARDQVVRLRDAHPDKIRTRIAAVEDGWFDVENECDWQAMHADQSFTNLMIANIAGQGATALLVDAEVEALERLKAELAKAEPQ